MNDKTRIEKDFLGEKEIPINVYYGIQTQRAKENFPITGYTIDKDLIKSLGIVKKAAAYANMEIGLLDEKIAKAIIEACDEIINGNYVDEFIVDPIQGGAGTSINMNANEVIANIALEKIGELKGNYSIISPNSHVNMAQSTNDAFPTAIHISIITAMKELMETYNHLYETFIKKSNEFDSVIKMGRTHLQDAVPIRLGQEFLSHAAVVSRDIKRINECIEAFTEVNMGATAVGTGLNADKKYIEKVIEYLAKFSKYNIKIVKNLVDGTQNTDAYTHLSSCLKIGMINLSKIGNDLRLMASGSRAGLYEIKLPARQPGSSIMPGKVNPVMVEVLNQVAFQVMGNDLTVSMASEAGQFELNVMEPVMYFNLMQSIRIMTNVFKVFDEFCLSGIEANIEILNQYVEKSIGIITAINPYVGYETASKIAKEAVETGKSVRELCIHYNVLSKEELDIILNPYEMTNIGIAGSDILKMKKN